MSLHLVFPVQTIDLTLPKVLWHWQLLKLENLTDNR
jgi:hypothetical protein